METKELCSLEKEGELRVSSVISKNSKEFGKQFMMDDSEETCWSSDQGTPQWVAIKWATPVKIVEIKAKFQGGFCGCRDTVVEGWTEEDKAWEPLQKWPLEDVGDIQTLAIPDSKWLNRIRIIFPQSTDFYGRIILYALEILGRKS